MSTKNRLPFVPTRRELALALFYNVELPTAGNGTLSEAEEQAQFMLTAGKLYDACQHLVWLIDRQARQRIFDRELIAVADLAREALQEADVTQA